MSLLETASFTDEIKFEAYGLRIGVRVTDPSAIGRIRGILPFYSTVLNAASETDYNFSLIWAADETGEDTLYQGDEWIATRVDTERLIALLDTYIRVAIGERAPGHVFIHAGVVGWQGKAMIFPAKSYSGKTTLTAELVRLGATYYSDEYAVIDANGMAHPYPKPLSMRKEGEYEQTDRHVSEFGGVQGVEPLPVGMVLMTTFKPDAEWSPRILTQGEGIMELIPHCLAIASNPEFVLKVLNLINKRAIMISSIRGESSTYAKLILNFPENHICT